MEVKILGAGKEVTGSCYSLITKDEKILIDCGMFQGGKDMIKLNYEDFDFDPKQYEALLLTHAHLDHCGRIPKLMKEGFRGKIFATDATRELANLIMSDSAKIAFEDTEHENKRRAKEGLKARKPIYSDVDVRSAMKLFVTVRYGEDVKVTPGITARFYNAGHILGSASIQLRVEERKKKSLVVFSGDLGQAEAVLVKNAEPISKADYVFIESTYGDILHPPIEERKQELLKVILDTYKKGGKLMIPSFTVERAQEIIYLIGEFMRTGAIPKIKVYLDSPMAMKATAIFSKYPQYYHDNIGTNAPFSFPELIPTPTVDESKMINNIREPCIIIAGNGMCTAGRIKHHIRNGISDPKNTLLLVGYQVHGSLGYWLKSGEKRVRLLGVEMDVKADVKSIEGFSSHADYNGLINWLNNFSPKPRKVFITHGNEEEAKSFSARLKSNGFNSYIPSLGETMEL